MMHLRLFSLIFVPFLLFSSPLFGQSSYLESYESTGGNPGGLNTTSDDDNTGWSSVLAGGQSVNLWSANQTIPFTFEFFGVPVTQFKVSANGLVTFDVASAALPSVNTNLPNPALPNNTIACFWDEFTNAVPTGSNDEIYTRLFGTAGSRQLWIKWFSFEYGNPSGNSFNYLACVLEEGTNRVYVVDMGSSANAVNMSTTVGVQKDATTAVQFGDSTITFTDPGSSSISNNTYYQFDPFQQFNDDVALLDINAPAGSGCFDANAPISITLRNLGANAASGITASFSVDGGSFSIPETIPATVQSGDSLTYTLTATANLATLGAHTLEVGLGLAGDGDLSNNSVTNSVSTQSSVAAPYAENFDAGIPANWFNDTNDDGEDWRNSDNGTAAFGPTTDHTSGTGEYMWVDDSSPHSEATNFISPCIDLSSLSFPTMDFWAWSSNQGPSVDMMLHVDVEAGGLWTNDVIAPIGDFAPAWNRFVVGLSAYTGQTIRVRFRMEETGGGFEHDIAIDDFSVFENVGNDVALLSLVAPVGDDCGLDQELVSIQVVNLGANAATGITASFAVDNGAPIPAEIIPGILAPTDTLLYTFAATADLSGLGTHQLDVFINLLGDADLTNDSLFISLTNLQGVSAPYEQNFDSGFPADWFNDPNDTGEDWITSASGNAGFGAGATDHTSGVGEYLWVDDSGPHGSETNLITPCIDITTMIAPEMEFWVWSENSDLTRDDMLLHVDIGVGGVFVNDVIAPIGHIGTGWNLVQVDLAAYSGNTIKVRFRIEEQDTGFQHDISLDDFRIFESLDDDVSLVVIDAPSGATCGFTANEAVTIQVTNNGSNIATGMTASFQVNGGAFSAPETIPGTLAPGVSTTYTFGATANLLAPGLYSITAVASITADQNPLNDSLSTVVETLLPTAPPITETFDNYLNGATLFDELDNDPTAEIAWEANFGPTATGNTGPSDDVSGGGGYIYLESSGSNDGDQGIVCFECVDLTGATAPNLVFSYHMYGSSVGSLSVDIDNGGVVTNEFLLTGEQQTTNTDPWVQDTVSLSAYVGSVIQICFTGTILADASTFTFNGDIGLDEIRVREFVATDVAVLGMTLPPAGCSLGNETVSINVQNQGISPVSTVIASYSINGGPFSALEIIPGSIQPGATAAFSFNNLADLSAIGVYTITAAISVNGDGNSLNDTITATTEHLPLVSSFPYFENFEGGTNGWSSSGTFSSWAFGTPAKSVIAGAGSGANAWTTGGIGAGTYNSNEASAVLSPCIDLTSLPANAAVALKVWWQSESSFDGAALQSSIDGGQNWSIVGAYDDPINWYNDTLINGTPGGQNEGWTGSTISGDGSGGWIQAQHSLDPALAGESDVRFRVVFGADASEEDDGFAFDDFAIGVPPSISLGPDSLETCGGDILNAGPGFSSYLWSNGATSQTVSLINLTGQNIVDSIISVIVTDSVGLVATDFIVVTISGNAPEVSATVNNQVSCFGETDGIAFAQGNGGTGTLAYSWNTNPVQNTQVATNLGAGQYVVTLTDQVGCIATDSVTILQPDALSFEINSIMNVNCAGDTDGSVNVSIVGGEAPYTILWDNGSTDTVLTGLSEGIYEATVTDANGCENVASIEIEAANQSPQASFSYTTSGTGGLTVSFNNTSSGTGAYAWDFGDGAGISSAQNPTYTYASDGSYVVLLILSNACGTSSVRDTVTTGLVGVEDLLSNQLLLYPNPSQGILELSVSGLSLHEAELQLFNLQGQAVYVEPLGELVNGIGHTIQLPAGLTNGMYLLQVRSREGVMHKRLTLRR